MKIGSWYATEHILDAAERTVFRRVLEICDRPTLLDLGVGAGRTTKWLLPLTVHYVGVDVSPEMVERSQKRFSGIEFQVEDARKLSFRDKSFDVVFFSYNGIDYVDHPGRLTVLAEVYRVLRPNGIFLFSTHNLDKTTREPFFGTGSLSFKLVTLARYLVFSPLIITGKFRHLSMRRYEVKSIDYEIRNDPAHEHRLLTYYISAYKQVEQLKKAGFADVEMFNQQGRKVDTGSRDTESNWLYYLCRK
jgi:SAM-dependent methyltransferase